MKDIRGKKLLIIGGNPLETEIVKRAKELGIYTVVTDYYEDFDDAPAKSYADEVWNVNWNDTSKLKEFCVQHNIDGALAGFSEFKVEALIRLTSAMGWPCYITQEQLDLTADKEKFKNECVRYGIPTVQQFLSLEEVDTYPVIVKPVDRGGSIGISVCYDREELIDAYDKAKKLSPSSKVIIERYLGDCRKIDLYYVIQHGEPVLFSTCDTIMSAEPSKGLEILQLGWVFPSKHHAEISRSVNGGICRMLDGLGIYNGYITISGFIDNERNIYIFEAGCRLSGELSYKRSLQMTGANYLDMLIEIALCGEPEEKDYVSEEKQSEYMFVENCFLKNGKVASKLADFDMEGVEYVDMLFNRSTVNHQGSLLPKGAMIFVCGKDREELLNKVKLADSRYDVMDTDGVSLVEVKTSASDLESYFESEI